MRMRLEDLGERLRTDTERVLGRAMRIGVNPLCEYLRVLRELNEQRIGIEPIDTRAFELFLLSRKHTIISLPRDDRGTRNLNDARASRRCFTEIRQIP